MISPLKGYLRGLYTPFRGIGFLCKNKSFWAWVLPPALVNTAITLVALVVLVALSWLLIDWVYPLFGTGFWQWVFKWLAVIGVVLAVLGLTVVVWLILINVCAGYLLSVLAGRVERRLGLREDEIHPVPLTQEVKEAVIETSRVLGIHGLAFAAQFIPVVGTAVSVPVVLLADAYIFGGEFLNYPMGVRGLSLEERTVFIRRHRAEAVGMGSTILPLGLVPIVGGFMMAFATVGAVLLYRELVENEKSAAGE